MKIVYSENEMAFQDVGLGHVFEWCGSIYAKTNEISFIEKEKNKIVDEGELNAVRLSDGSHAILEKMDSVIYYPDAKLLLHKE